jgi:hypothetical protein
MAARVNVNGGDPRNTKGDTNGDCNQIHEWGATGNTNEKGSRDC